MKYARLIYGDNEKQLSTAQYINIGDYFQTFAIDNLYKQIGIKRENIYSLDKIKIGAYRGEEQLVLPMQGWFGHIKGYDIFPLPERITPVFLGYHSVTKYNYSEECLDAYRKNAPVCCRDEATYDLMQKYGIPSYLTGCMTITLPERKEVPKTPHVFLVDAPNGIEKYLPADLAGNVTVVTHEVPYFRENGEAYELERIENLSRELMERYKKEATLVVTSRLHCASPCLGMGIPVILARNYFDDRYAWIDKYLPLYTPDCFDKIDWYPSKVDLSYVKPKLIEMAEKAILNREDKEAPMKELHEFYMERNRGKIQTPFYTKAYFSIHAKFPKTADFLREVVLKRFTVATGRKE